MYFLEVLFFALIAVSASVGTQESVYLDGEPQSIAPEMPNEKNPDLDLFFGAEFTPVAYNNLDPAPDPCIGSTGDLRQIGKSRVRRECDELNFGTGHKNGIGNGNGNGNGNGKHQEGSDQQNIAPPDAAPQDGGAGNAGSPNLPFGRDPLDECKSYFDVFDYVVCNSGRPNTSSRRDIVPRPFGRLPNQLTYILNHCSQGMFRQGWTYVFLMGY